MQRERALLRVVVSLFRVPKKKNIHINNKKVALALRMCVLARLARGLAGYLACSPPIHLARSVVFVFCYLLVFKTCFAKLN